MDQQPPPNCLQRVNNVLDDDEVDTTLRLCSLLYVSRNPEFLLPPVAAESQNSRARWFLPDFFDGVEDDEVDTTLRLGPPKSANKSRKRGYDGNEGPLVPIEENEGLFKAMQSRRGRRSSRPIFLYRKVLAESDASSNYYSTLHVTRSVREMGFLSDKEVAAVEGGGGLQRMVGVDGSGNVYGNLVWTKRASFKLRATTVITSDWNKVVAANSAKKGDVVEIWGFRDDWNQLCLAFNFLIN